jgi:hypothetical protein
MDRAWPEISTAPWEDTRAALHLWCQIVGKYRLARTPWLNHSWHTTLYVSARGLTTSLVPDVNGGIEVGFDFIDHRLVGTTPSGRVESFALGPMSVAAFHDRFCALITALGGTARLHGRPNEIAGPTLPFAEDLQVRPYDAAAVARFFQALAQANRVLNHFRTGFIGKASPVHFFWGGFDLAVTRFSGRRAPEHPGGFPAIPDAVMREAYSHEVASAGFWLGGGSITEPVFYAYAYPEPPGFALAPVPDGAFYSAEFGEFFIAYETVRRAADPEAALLAFLQSTYAAAADLGGWDRAALEAPLGEPRRPRPL